MDRKIENYEIVFETMVNKLAKYVTGNKLKSLVLGVSGGIDSTVVSAVIYEVSKLTGTKIIGRSLPIKNKADEKSASYLVGEAFFKDFKIVNLSGLYERALEDLSECRETQTPIANGNIQARLRMMYLYNLAGTTGGMVMDTDNLTEHYLGFWTIHGDEGDFNPIAGLWKTEIYELAKYLLVRYSSDSKKLLAIQTSINLTPTDGLGISNSDLEQIGASSYKEVDESLKTIICGYDCEESAVKKNVFLRYWGSRFKRNPRPFPITRNELFNINIEEKENKDNESSS